jgi:hypothetical protein
MIDVYTFIKNNGREIFSVTTSSSSFHPKHFIDVNIKDEDFRMFYGEDDDEEWEEEG